jgi:hypothetical protein
MTRTALVNTRDAPRHAKIRRGMTTICNGDSIPGVGLHSLDARTTLVIFALLFSACNRTAPRVSGPLSQRGYVWQRDWTAAVDGAVLEAQKRMNGVIVLGAEISWAAGKPEIVRANINWEMLRSHNVSCGIVLRIAPYPGPFSADDATAHFIVSVAKSLVDLAASHGFVQSEFQIDFDCPQRNLQAYRVWLRVLREAVHPLRFVLTTLPAWLDDPEFVQLVRDADAFVLQVHSVPTLNVNDRANLCDAQLARTWVSKAARLGLPFSVALPTYRCSAGYDATGKLLGVAMDSVQPAWPPNTRVLEFATNADEMAMLVKEWQQARPPQLREIIWYRVPVVTDMRNWRWTTLSAVMSGRKPLHQLEVVQEGENPIDLSIANTGEADEQLDPIVTASWNSTAIVAVDALPGWTVDVTNGRALFTPAAEHQMRLSPGGKRRIGWLRYERPASLQLALTKKE